MVTDVNQEKIRLYEFAGRVILVNYAFHSSETNFPPLLLPFFKISDCREVNKKEKIRVTPGFSCCQAMSLEYLLCSAGILQLQDPPHPLLRLPHDEHPDGFRFISSTSVASLTPITLPEK